MRLLIFLFPLFLSAQTYKICGKISNEHGETLAFANVANAENLRVGTLSDIKGEFCLNSRTPIRKIMVSYIGYKKQTIDLQSKTYLLITLHAQDQSLTEVVVYAEDNPANRLMKRVIQHRESNNPDNLEAYQCKIYNKFNFDFLPNQAKIDSLEKSNPVGKIKENTLKSLKNMNEKAITQQVFLMESVTERSYQKPQKVQHTVLLNKVSGLKQPLFAGLAEQIQPFSFYNNRFRLFDKFYHSPLASDALNFYDFKMQDTLYMEQDTLYRLTFAPQKGINFEALKGILFVNSRKYAIQNVRAEPLSGNTLKISIEQQYQNVGEIWFPEQLNFTMLFEKYPHEHVKTKMEGKSFVSDVRINPKISQSVFTLPESFIEQKAHQQPDSLWAKYRMDSLSVREQNTYQVLDSLGKKNHFDAALKVIGTFSEGLFPLGKISLDLFNSVKINPFEGLRLGVGLRTNNYFSKIFSVGVYAGFGLKDQNLKYGLFAQKLILPDVGLSVAGFARQDIQEVGKQTLWGFQNLRVQDFFAARFDAVKQYGFSVFKNTKNAWNFGIEFTDTRHRPLYVYDFDEKNGQYHFPEISALVRFNNVATNTFSATEDLPSKYPNLSLTYAKGLDEYDYHRLSFNIQQNIPITHLGLLRYKISAGWIDKTMPYMKLFSDNGVSQVALSNTFKTLNGYEFLSDKQVSLFLRYDFPKVLYTHKYSKPSLSLVHNAMYGTLRNPEKQRGIAFKTLEQGFLERGVEVRNLLKINYLNFGKMNLGFGLYQRYGANRLPESKANWLFTLLITFSFD